VYDRVRASYDLVVERYAEEIGGELTARPVSWAAVRRGSSWLAIAATLAVAALVACGTDSGSAAGSTKNPAAWAGQVCAALTPWRGQIALLNARAQQQVTAASTPTQTREDLLDLLAGGETASETARAAVVAAGAPDVDGGTEVAGRFAASLAQTRDAYAAARAELLALSTDDGSSDGSRFYAGVASVLSTLTAEYARAGVDTSGLDSVELRAAFDEADGCR
jgi:hypothetical protein